MWVKAFWDSEQPGQLGRREQEREQERRPERGPMILTTVSTNCKLLRVRTMSQLFL